MARKENKKALCNIFIKLFKH